MSVATPALPVRAERLWAALLAATLMNLPLGSVYAFSVLLRPIEQELAIPRSALSLVFGLATVGFTVGSVGAAFLYRAAPAPILVLLSALAAAAGLLTAAAASGLAQLLVGYGIVFGTGGGVAYILLQQGVNMLVRRRQGLVNGYIVSLYPMGAMIATPAFHACNETFGWRTTLGGLATVLVACGIAAALLARHSGARLVAPKSSGETQPGTLGLTFFKLSATFFLAASAGLMVLSQAREIVASYGGAAALAVAATTGLTGAIALGPRLGRVFKRDGGGMPPGHNMTLAALGGIILWFGWYGFNPGSTLSAMDFEGIGRIATNTTLAACSGSLLAMAYVYFRTKKFDTGISVNGLLAGLVAITCPCYWVSPFGAVCIGAVAGVIVVLAVDQSPALSTTRTVSRYEPATL